MPLKKFQPRHVRNANAARERPYGDAERRILSGEAFAAMKAEIEKAR